MARSQVHWLVSLSDKGPLTYLYKHYEFKKGGPALTITDPAEAKYLKNQANFIVQEIRPPVPALAKQQAPLAAAPMADAAVDEEDGDSEASLENADSGAAQSLDEVISSGPARRKFTTAKGKTA